MNYPNKNPSSISVYTKKDDHCVFLFHQLNKSRLVKAKHQISCYHCQYYLPQSTVQATTSSQNTKGTPIDDPSVTPTLETLYTLDIWSLYQTITLYIPSLVPQSRINQPIVKYRRSNIWYQSWLPHSTAVQYALVGVHNKLLHPPTFSPIYCLYLLTCSIIIYLCSIFLFSFSCWFYHFY